MRVETGASCSRRSSLVCRQPCSVAAAPKLALIATAQPSSPGVTNWIVVSESSSTRSVSRVNRGGCAGGRDVGAVDERAQRALGDRGLDLVGLRVVGDQRVAVLLDRDVGVAVADLREGGVEVVGCATPRRSRSNASRAPSGRSSTSVTSPTWTRSTLDCAWSAKIPPNSTRNISGKTIAKNTDALSRKKPRMIATARLKKARPRSCAVLPPGEVEEDVLEGGGPHRDAVELPLLGQPVSTAAGSVVSIVSPSAVVIRVGAASPATSAAGVSSCRIRPWSMIATRSHSASASSM